MPVSDKPTVTVVIPLYNKVEYVEQTIKSVIAQEYKDVEIIVVDDGSTDGSSEIASRYSDNIRYLSQERSGVAMARNRGMELATGDFLAFLDADDPWFPQKLAWQVNFLTEHPEIQWCTTNFQRKTAGEELLLDSRARPEPGNDQPKWRIVNWFGAMARNEIRFQTSGVLIRMSMVRSVGLMDTSLPYGEDFDYWVRIAQRAPQCGYCLSPGYILTRDSAYSFTYDVADKYVGLAALLKSLIEHSKSHPSDVFDSDYSRFLEWICGDVIHRLIGQGHSSMARELISEFRHGVRKRSFLGYTMLSYVPHRLLRLINRLVR